MRSIVFAVALLGLSSVGFAQTDEDVGEFEEWIATPSGEEITIDAMLGDEAAEVAFDAVLFDGVMPTSPPPTGAELFEQWISTAGGQKIFDNALAGKKGAMKAFETIFENWSGIDLNGELNMLIVQLCDFFTDPIFREFGELYTGISCPL